MKRNVDIKEISDGRLYTANDMVRADTGGCVGCSVCCHGMGSSIILDPYDGFRLSVRLGRAFGELIEKELELNVVDGIILPNLKMDGPEEACAFLDGDGRCRIHDARPGVCRLFPLGRYYEGRDFRYFLQVHECRMENRAKVKVKRWLDTPELKRYEDYIRNWHYFLEDVQQFLDRENREELRKQVTLYLLKQFYLTAWEPGQDFYSQFEDRLQAGKNYLGMA